MADIKIGLKNQTALIVGAEHTVPRMPGNLPTFADMLPVFATAMLVAFVEDACAAAVKAYLAPGQKTVGVHVNLSHSAATPIGMRVSAEVELIEIEGRKLTFRVLCRDEKDIIGEGTHQRFIIDEERFMDRLKQKSL